MISCSIKMFNQSLISVFGLMFGDYLTALGEDAFGAALIMNVCNISLNFSGKNVVWCAKFSDKFYFQN